MHKRIIQTDLYMSSMVIIYTLLLCVGFYIRYTATARAPLYPNLMVRWAQSYQMAAKAVGYLTMLLAFVIMFLFHGFGTGLFFGILLLMAGAGLTIILLPVLTTGKKQYKSNKNYYAGRY